MSANMMTYGWYQCGKTSSRKARQVASMDSASQSGRMVVKKYTLSFWLLSHLAQITHTTPMTTGIPSETIHRHHCLVPKTASAGGIRPRTMVGRNNNARVKAKTIKACGLRAVQPVCHHLCASHHPT